MRFWMMLLGWLCSSLGVWAATPAVGAGGFDPQAAFAPLILPQPVNTYRSGSGRPGPGYWQNRADYQLHAKLDPARRRLDGEAVITYTNRSPDALDALWLYLDQNIYRADARSALAVGWAGDRHTEGMQIDAVALVAGGRRQPLPYLIDDTRMRVDLARPLLARGGVLRLAIRYHYTIPGPWGGRTAVTPSKQGDIFEMAQWYPRMAVYDDLRGWDSLPYLGYGEFYLEYGDFDYTVTLPAEMLVAGSGELVNPQAVLTATERQRLAQARRSDRTVYIVKPDEVGTAGVRPRQAGLLSWHFKMRNTRDVAFAASKAFVWDAARIRLPGGRMSLAMSVYPGEAVGPDRWDRATEYLKADIEYFSRQWYPYPWPVAVNLAGHGAGMEYPGMIFDGMRDHGKELFMITTHEIGHSWFPMIVGSNERRHAWMDEGFNTFIDIYAHQAFHQGEFAPKRDGEYAPGGGNPVEEIQSVLKDPAAPLIVDPADRITGVYRHRLDYFKPALGLVLLREQILGPARFDPAFRAYIRAWAYKHPSPSDFFRFMDSAAGEDLDWFWRGWYFQQWNMDLAIDEVSYPQGDPAKGAQLVISSRDRLVFPVEVQVDYADGARRRLRIPVEAWLDKARLTVPLPGGAAIRRVQIDPARQVPDADRGNNHWPRAAPSAGSATT